MRNQQRRRQARRSSKTTRQKQMRKGASFAWFWLLSGMFIGVLGIALIYQYLHKWPSLQSLLPKEAKLSPSTATLKPKKASPHPAEGRVVAKNTPKEKLIHSTRKHFEFYQLLPGMEVPISASAEEARLSSAPTVNPLPSPEITKKDDIPLPIKPAIMPTEKPVLKQPLKTPPSKLPKVLRKLAAAQYLLQVDAFKSANTANALRARLASQGFAPRIYKVEAEDGIWFRVTLGPYPSETMALKQKSLLERQKIHAILILQRQ